MVYYILFILFLILCCILSACLLVLYCFYRDYKKKYYDLCSKNANFELLELKYYSLKILYSNLEDNYYYLVEKYKNKDGDSNDVI